MNASLHTELYLVHGDGIDPTLLLHQLFLAATCSFMMEYDIHTILDGLTFLATLVVIYLLYGPLRSSYQSEEDSVQTYFVVCGSRSPAAMQACMDGTPP